MGDKSAGGSFGWLQPEHCDQRIGECSDLGWFWYRGQPIGPTGHDCQGVGGSGDHLSTLYLILHAICFWLLGLVLRNRAVTTVIARATYAGVGALSLMTFYLSFDAVMGSGGVVVASTRTTAGLFAHAATGAVSGLLFQLLTRGPASQSD